MLSSVALHKVHPYQFVPEEKIERFERIALSIYKDVSRGSRHFPVISKTHFFRNDEYGVAEALYDFVNEIFCTQLEKNNVYPGKSTEWTEDIWAAIDYDVYESMPFLESSILDDLYEHWNRNQLMFIDEHRTMTESMNVVHQSIQEVW